MNRASSQWAILAGAVLCTAASPLASQQLGPCRDGLGEDARCGRISVYENRTAARGRRLDVYFAVLPARGSTSREPIFMFAGGPGQGGTALVELANGPFAPVRETRDIVLVDQRGTGDSNPLTCAVDVVAHPAAAFGQVFDPSRIRRCREELASRADLRFYTTELAVADVDEIRAALGYDKIIVWGGSYGTRLAQAYIRAHPDRVTAAVLDGVVPFDFHAPSSYEARAQRSLDRVVADCEAAASCREAYSDLPAAFGRLLERFRGGPVPATIRRPDGTTTPVALSLGDFGYAVRGLLYSTAVSRALPAMIHRADSTGDLSPFAQRYWSRAASLAGAVADGLHLAVFCSEDVPFITADDTKSPTTPFLGDYLLTEYRAACVHWVRAPTSPSFQEPMRDSVPTLLISGWFDPVTPPETAERVARHLPNSRHLVIRNEGHGAGMGCARPATLHVMIKATLDGLPSVCDSVRSIWDR